MRQQLAGTRPQARVDRGPEHARHVARLRRLARLVGVLLRDVVVGQLRQRRVGIGQAGACHAPGADRRAHEVHALRRIAQPVSEQEAVERVQHQPLRPAGRGGHHPHVVRRQSALAQPGAGARAGMDRQRLHPAIVGVRRHASCTRRRPCPAPTSVAS